MKKYDQIITVEVAIASIAKKLLSVIDLTFPHRELLTETIIDSSLERGTISHIYNSINGFGIDLDITVGNVYHAPGSELSVYRLDKDRLDTNNDGTSKTDFDVLVLEINPYRADNRFIHVRYEFPRIGEEKLIEADGWVNHKQLKAIPGKQVDAVTIFDK